MSKKVKIEILRGTVVDGKRLIPKEGKKNPMVETSETIAKRLIGSSHARVLEDKPVKGKDEPKGKPE